jgi:hypothetical protein
VLCSVDTQTLPHTDTDFKVSDISSSDDDAPLALPPFHIEQVFSAGDRDEARKWLLEQFSKAHGGHEVCKNSNPKYVYCKCMVLGCSASCAAALVNDHQWRVSTLKLGADASCVAVRCPPSCPPTQVHPAFPALIEELCVLCKEVVPRHVTCHLAGHSICNDCFSVYVQSECSGDNLPKFMANNCQVMCPECLVERVKTPFDMHALGYKLTKSVFERYLKSVAEQEVLAALKVAQQESQKNSAADQDKVSLTLADLLSPEKCPSCNAPFFHSGGCTTMTCVQPQCKTLFCLWCRCIFKDNGAGHQHAWECQKRPETDAILTSSRVFPVGHDAVAAEGFIDALFKVRKLEMLQLQLQQGEFPLLKVKVTQLTISLGWSSEEARRLVTHASFQDFLSSIKAQQTKFRLAHPEKPKLLRFAFHKVCTLDTV